MPPASKEERQAKIEQRRANVRSMVQNREPVVITEISETDFRMFALSAIEEMVETIGKIEERILFFKGQIMIATQAAEDGLLVKIYQHEQSDGGVQYELKVSQKPQLGFRIPK